MESATTNVDQTRLGKPSASSFEIDVNCPGMRQLNRTIPKQAELTDDYILTGNKIHKARETGNILPLSSEEVDLYNDCLKFEEELKREWMAQNEITEFREGPNELRLWLNDPDTFEPMASGQLDIHKIPTKYRTCSLLIIDYKSGFSPYLPTARRSWQLRMQGVLAKSEYSDLPIENIWVAHVKPKVKAEPFDYAIYSLNDLAQAENSIFYHCWMVEQPGAPRRAGLHCNYCSCKAYCPEAAVYALLPSRSNASNPEAMIANLSVEDVKLIWQKRNVIDKIIKACTQRLKELGELQLKPYGLGLGKGRKTDAITDVEGAVEFLKKEGFSEKDIYYAMTFGSVKLVETVQMFKGKTKKNAEVWIDEQLAPFYTRGEADKPLIEI